MTAAKPKTVDIAKRSDEDELVDLLRLKHEEDGAGGAFSEARERIFVKRGIRGKGGCIGVIRGRRRIEASVGLFTADFCWPTAPGDHLYDRWHFVHPQHRRTDHGRHLLEFVKWISATCERPVMMIHIVNDRTAMKCVLFEKTVGAPLGHVYIVSPSGSPHQRSFGTSERAGRDIAADLRGISKNAQDRLIRHGVLAGLPRTGT